MNATTARPEARDEAAAYLAEVATHLTGLSEEERVELMDDLGEHLTDVAAEDGPPLAERLGPPSEYAAELLAAAGLAAEVDPSAPATEPAPSRWRRLGRRATRARQRGLDSPAGRYLLSITPVLRPAWWVARGYLAVAALALLTHHGDTPRLPVPHLFGNPVLDLVAIAGAIALSIRIAGMEMSRPLARVVRAADLGLVLCALVLIGHADGQGITYYPVPEPTTASGSRCLTNGDGGTITNLFAYDEAGHLLDSVLLYDQSGHPIDNLCPDVDDQGRSLQTTYRTDVNGATVANVFPRAQRVLPEMTVEVPGNGTNGSVFTTVPAGSLAGTPVPPPAVILPKLTPTTTSTTPAP